MVQIGARKEERVFKRLFEWFNGIKKDNYEGMLRANVHESGASIQLVCPYCDKIQIKSHVYHVIHNPPDFWDCEKCGKKFKVVYGLDYEATPIQNSRYKG